MEEYYTISKDQWDKEYKDGYWEYLDKNPEERIRHAVIGIYLKEYIPSGKVLDVGCGVGTLFDFLNSEQQRKYVGIDISSVAIDQARKRRSQAKFICDDCDNYKVKEKFDAIIFNESLYFIRRNETLPRYIKCLNKKGLIITSVYSTHKFKHGRNSLKEIGLLMKPLNKIELSSILPGKKITWHIIIARPANNN